MCSVRLMLGWEQLGQVDESALASIRSLCRALDMRTHWNAAEETLYIESPASARSIAVLTVPANLALYTEAAGQITDMLKRLLEQAGARICDSGNLHEAELVLRCAVGSHASWGVAATYGWSARRSLRSLAELVSAETARQAGLEDLGGKVSLTVSRSTRAPVLDVAIGRPDRGNSTRLQDPAFFGDIAAGIFRGLCRYWSGPVLAEVLRHLPAAEAEEDAPAAPMPAPEAEPQLLVAQPELLIVAPAPIPTAKPDPLPAVEPDPDPDPEPEPEPVFTAPEPPITEPEPYHPVAEEPEESAEPLPELEPEPEPDPGVIIVEPDQVLVLPPVKATSTECRPAPTPPVRRPPEKRSAPPTPPAALKPAPLKPTLPAALKPLLPAGLKSSPVPPPVFASPQPLPPPPAQPPQAPPQPQPASTVIRMFQWPGQPAKRTLQSTSTSFHFRRPLRK